jgi:PAS domain-containing protein
MSELLQSLRAWLKQAVPADEDEDQVAFYLQMIVLIVLVGAVAMGLTYAVAGRWDYVGAALVNIFIYSIIFLLIRRKRLKFAINLFLVSALFFLTAGILAAGGIHSSSSMIYPIILIFSSLLLERKFFAIYSLFCIASVGIIIYAEQAQLIPAYVPDAPNLPLFITISLIILGAALTVRFVTDTLQSNLQKKRQSEALYRSLVEVLPMNVCTKDLEGRFTFINKHYCDQFNLSPADILGKNDFDMHPKDLAEKYRQDDRAVIASGKAVEMVEEH